MACDLIFSFILVPEAETAVYPYWVVGLILGMFVLLSISLILFLIGQFISQNCKSVPRIYNVFRGYTVFAISVFFVSVCVCVFLSKFFQEPLLLEI